MNKNKRKIEIKIRLNESEYKILREKSGDIRIFNKLFKNFGEFIQFCPSSKSFKNSIILSKAFW
uniref:Uncharacterized protein n=1 Tax=Actinobacillus porcitonsillarum TaxID=189834 RepID=A8WW11_9PAST|nr:hypothetical protein [Actinobacillus porcitonsillarum]